MTTRQTVFVGLSGGVDSSVAALRLKNDGYNVVGVFIKVWHPDFMICNWEQERLDAMRVAAHLEIPFLTCDAETAYRDGVAHYFIEEYRAGRTPNPDVMCNQHVKFGAFLQFAKEHGADLIATGHYAQRLKGDGGPELHRGFDDSKDQTYFLWSLSTEQLTSALFPVGDTPKDQIRQEAKSAGIPVASKKDSQGICFLGHVDITEFLSHYVTLSPGSVLNEQGEVIGEHKGALVYTLGQRHGFTIHTKSTEQRALFVVDRNLAKNTITVAEKKKVTQKNEEIIVSNTVIRATTFPTEKLEAQFRYRQQPLAVKIVNSTTDNTLTLVPEKPTEVPAVGQSCVLYRGTHCLGGGIVC